MDRHTPMQLNPNLDCSVDEYGPIVQMGEGTEFHVGICGAVDVGNIVCAVAIQYAIKWRSRPDSALSWSCTAKGRPKSGSMVVLSLPRI